MKSILLFFCSRWIFCYSFFTLNMATDYEPPSSIAYPFGDEMLNVDINEAKVAEEPNEISTQLIKDVYIVCPNVTDEVCQDEGETPYNDNLCAKCDVRPTADKRAALVECYNCTDNPASLKSEAGNSPDHILFLTTYLEIANYSIPELLLY